MKNLLCFLTLLFLNQLVFAQVPQGTSYQAIIRNPSGNLLSNQLVKLRFSIHDSSANGNIVYQETQMANTNEQGLINLFVGKGIPVIGSFTNINWGSKSKFLQTEIDITGGINYTDMGTTQLMSVPYALYANTSANGLPNGTTNGDILYWNGTSWQKVTAGTYGQLLTICDGVPTWGGCLPKVYTLNTYSISFNTATGFGNVISEGGVSVTERGICWSTSLNPTTLLTTKIISGSGLGPFTGNITGLTPNTLYHVRAYAKNSVGTTYGDDLTFTTLAGLAPTITTNAISSLTINNSSATGGGNITSDNGASVTARGICWSTTANPTISLTTKTIDGTGLGEFTSNMTGLLPLTTYYVRAYATNSFGTAYGTQQTFTTTNQTLPSITIGAQLWSSVNLSVSRYRNGDLIPQVTDQTQWASLTTGAWCWYNNDSARYAATYGKMYNWYALNDSRGLAPLGWHIPTESEWNKLVKYLDAGADTTCSNCTQSTLAGGAMKSTTVWTTPNTGATNSSGFSAFPGGYRSETGTFNVIGVAAYFWTPGELNTASGRHRYLMNNSSNIFKSTNLKQGGFSIRVIRD
jgi:uncharacterized protein (TIGR02145 family)